MIRLVVAKGCGATGKLLEEALRERGIKVNQGNILATVSYGVRMNQGKNVLNWAAGGGDKLAELQTLGGNGVNIPKLWTSNQWRDAVQGLPVLGRRRNHHGGIDIRLIRTRRGLEVWSQKRDFFTQYIQSDREYRVQVYRSAHLGTYEKVLAHPELKHKAVGRNHRNGYAFQICKEGTIPRDAVEMAKKAVKVLGLDFGAVDILHGVDGRYYVLEVNTAPGGEAGRQWLNSLADKIVKWAGNGCPGRKEE